MARDARVLRIRDRSAMWREIAGETVLLDIASARYLGVNRSGSILWAALLEGATRDQLVQQLVDAFAIDAAQAAQDVDAFVDACNERGLLE